ncbi:hypothetical protein BDQ17DRAFT_1541898 [Cyathus striatus]|nr:hypothetical protein BDQ17DRAFT_1541898 [Cyathus striatus]
MQPATFTTSSQLHIEPSTPEAASVFTKASLDNTRRRRPWTDEEDEILRKAVEQEHPEGSPPFRWLAIAKHVPEGPTRIAGRDGAIEKYGTNRWPLVSAMVGTRKSCQCARRWYDTLNPSIDRTPWSKDDDAKLLAAVNNHGKKWSYIAKTFFPGRTGLATKNRFVALATSSARHTGERGQSQSSDEDYTELFSPSELSSPASSESSLPPHSLFADPYLVYQPQTSPPDSDYLSLRSRSTSLSTPSLSSQIAEEAAFLFQDQFPIFTEKQPMENYQTLFPDPQISPFPPVPHFPAQTPFDPLEGLFDTRFDPWDPALLNMFQQLDHTQPLF